MSYIEFRNITKAFGTCVSCRDISLSIKRSTVHAIIGENGAGKSTLMKLLGGLFPASSGQIYLNSQLYSPHSAQDAFHNKIAFIHQHFVLADQLSALDNLILSFSSDNFSLKTKPATDVAARADALLKQFGWKINLRAKVKNLSVGEQQRLEILKALMPDPDIIIFDEPTAVLTPQESHELMKFILQLKSHGKTVILISHKLNEIKYVADDISILRQGSLVSQHAQQDLTLEQMAELMIGRRLQQSQFDSSTENQKTPISLPDSDIHLRKNEIFGVAGIEGNGQDELIAHFLTSLRQHKIPYGDITEDRLKLSVFQDMNLMEHVLLRHKGRFLKKGLLQTELLKQETEALLKEWDVRPPEADKLLADLSGGNQQKFVVGRELLDHPQVLLAAHPSRGVDLGAQEKIHQSLYEYTRQGNTVLLVSADLDEVLLLSDRFIVLNKNKIYGPFNKGQLTEQEIGMYMAGDL
ncbi:ABC transporter ATP-binding protein [Pseudobdellovibrio exovorus]|uniref:Sugar ABC transporter, ATP-binding protein n=1 Tax=Pseudobdellovibrio exovorus JSS TaxID=1184267 RepID=M4V6B0_9BACT|nr:ATP-binding cassette domain-containing protein [Pseudobdellovibrio exovorus]AGH94733.1 sugar ABC transporter, ATP-binding protein [Pseudobdellovibrio exovorus JSS]